jgi:preprotein translocase subunit YajC
MLFISDAIAQEAAAGSLLTSGWGQLIPFVLIFFVFYFMFIKPASKKEKEHKGMISSMKPNTRVLTTSGIFGKITKVNDAENSFTLRIAPDVDIEISKTSVTEVIEKKTNNIAQKLAGKKKKDKEA